jgi:hypothetical protein
VFTLFRVLNEFKEILLIAFPEQAVEMEKQIRVL